MKSRIRLGKPPYPIQRHEEGKAAKVKTKNTDQNKVVCQLIGEIRVYNGMCQHYSTG